VISDIAAPHLLGQILGHSEDHYTLFHNEGKYFTDLTREAGLYEKTIPFLGWGAIFLDYNNDGFRDLFTANGHIFPEVDLHFRDTPYREQLLLFENTGKRNFQDVSAESGLAALMPRSARGAAACDYDNDGRIDLVVVNTDDVPTLLRNQHKGGNWLEVRTIGTRSNRGGIGARVEIVAGDLKQADLVRTGSSFMSQNDMRVHFGLGTRRRVDQITVRWPSGLVDRVANVPADQQVTITEGKGR